jgi:hypothetical protein
MVTRQKTLKIIKQKVDARTKGVAKLRKNVTAQVRVGISRKLENKTITKLYKYGNSIMCIDNNYVVRNINELDTKALRIIMWQLITDKEKKELALEHLYSTITYLK